MIRGSIAFLNVPFLVEYDKEAHAAGGALIGACWFWLLRGHVPPLIALTVAVSIALTSGAVKEYVLDMHADWRDIPPWGLGAATAVAFWMAIRHGA